MTSGASPQGARDDRALTFPVEPEVGDFRQGSEGSRWLLGRYLLGRVIGEFVSGALLIIAIAIAAFAVAMYFVSPTWLAVLIGLVAVAVLAVRVLFAAVLRRFSGAALFGPVEDRMRPLVSDTRSDVQRELRRLGLPSRVWTMPLLAWRLRRHRRADTLRRFRDFDAARVVPASRVDELHLLVRSLDPPRR